MTREQFAILVKSMKAVYASDNFIKDKDAFDVWYVLLKDLPYELLATTIQKYMTTEKFPPTPADIRRIATQISSKDEENLTEIEAWGMVRKACQNLDWMNPEGEYNKLPEVVRRAVGNPNNLKEWASSNIGDFETVISSNFMRTYKAVSKVCVENRQLSPSVREKIETMKTNSNYILGETDHGDTDNQRRIEQGN